MDIVGIIKEFDMKGRVVIPKELRKRYSIEGSVELIATKDGILVRRPKEFPEEKTTEELSRQKVIE